ncbi:hypothetical protein FXO37_12150 [Capsicum annuum]|nr:hypothetical protein FXO37_12150 [Capsicum annuum]
MEQQTMLGNSCTGGELWNVEEATPIATAASTDIIEMGRSTSAWVRQNIIKLGKMFKADFKGHEEEALELLMQVDACRQARRLETSSEIRKNRFKGANELKNLITFDVKFKRVYAPNCKVERREVRDELGAVKGILEGPWAVCGDLNVCRFSTEKRDCQRRISAMIELSVTTEDLELKEVIHGSEETLIMQHQG